MELEDRREQLHLLAYAARGLGFDIPEDYQAPSEQIAEDLAGDPEETATVNRGLMREIEVREFLSKVGELRCPRSAK